MGKLKFVIMVRILARVNFCYCPIASKVVKIDSKIISLSQKSKSVTRSVVKWLINGRLSEAAISYLKKQTKAEEKLGCLCDWREIKVNLFGLILKKKEEGEKQQLTLNKLLEICLKRKH